MDDGIAMSRYNGLQLSLRRNMPSFSFIAGYTYSKDTAWDDYGPWKNYALNDTGNGRTNWDVPHRFSFSWNYYLSSMQGQNAFVRHRWAAGSSAASRRSRAEPRSESPCRQFVPTPGRFIPCDTRTGSGMAACPPMSARRSDGSISRRGNCRP